MGKDKPVCFRISIKELEGLGSLAESDAIGYRKANNDMIESLRFG